MCLRLINKFEQIVVANSINFTKWTYKRLLFIFYGHTTLLKKFTSFQYERLRNEFRLDKI